MSYCPQKLAVKRLLAVRSDIDAAVLAIAGTSGYAKFVNDALLIALQTRGIEEIEAVLEYRYGPLTAEDHAEAERRLFQARERASNRLGKRKTSRRK